MTYYGRHLPHWQSEGAALFITWRLHGSLPASTATLEHSSPVDPFSTFDRELDKAATGPRWLEDARIAQCVFDTLKHGERPMGLYRLRAWAMMPNHVHILVHPEAALARITKAIKNYSARKANAILGTTGAPFWQHESHDHWVRGPEELEKIVVYIEQNPVAADLVEKVEDWRWSSAFAASQ